MRSPDIDPKTNSALVARTPTRRTPSLRFKPSTDTCARAHITLNKQTQRVQLECHYGTRSQNLYCIRHMVFEPRFHDGTLTGTSGKKQTRKARIGAVFTGNRSTKELTQISVRGPWFEVALRFCLGMEIISGMYTRARLSESNT